VKSGKILILALILVWTTASFAHAGLSFLRGELNAQAGKIVPSVASETFTPDEGHDFTFQAELVFFDRFALGGEFRTKRFENQKLVSGCFMLRFPYHSSLRDWEWKARLFGSYLKLIPFKGKAYEIYFKGGMLVGTYENRGEYRIDPYAENNPPTCMEYITCTTKHHWGYEFGIGATANVTRLWGLMCEVQYAQMRLFNEAMYPVLHGTDIPVSSHTNPFPHYVDEIKLGANSFKSGLEWVDLRFGLVFFIGR